MQHLQARRLFAGFAVAGALIATGAGPAYAAPPADVDIDMYVTDTTVAAGADGVQVTPIFFASAEVLLEQPTVTFEVTGAAGITLDGDGEELSVLRAGG